MPDCEICLEQYEEGLLDLHRATCVSRLVFRCTICSVDFVSREGLWNHLHLHEVVDNIKELHCQEIEAKYKLHRCALCNDQRSFSDASLRQHIENVHGTSETQHRTEDSDLNGLVEESQQNKGNSHHGKKRKMKAAKTETEAKVDDKKSKLADTKCLKKPNLPNKAEDKPYSCTICGSAYGTRNSLWRHKVVTHTEPRLKCCFCPTLFHLPDKLRRHIDFCSAARGLRFNHKSSKHSKDDNSNKAKVENPENATQTEENHSEGKKEETGMELHDCSEQPGGSPSSQRHEHTSKDDEVSPASEVKAEPVDEHKTTTKARKFRRGQYEIPVHDEAGVLVYPCSICKLTFPSKSLQVRHVSSYHKERQYKCSFCEKVYPFDSEVRRHEKKCAKIRCQQCGVVFTSRALLEVHEISNHTNIQHGNKFYHKETKPAGHQNQPVGHHSAGDKGFRCSQCGFKCTSHIHLWRHKIEKHTEPQRKCSSCRKSFHFGWQLNRHVQSCSARQCHKCGMMFASRTMLEKHKISKHSQDDESTTVEAESREDTTQIEEKHPKVKEEDTTTDLLDGFKKPERSTFSIAPLDGNIELHMDIKVEDTMLQEYHTS